MADRVRLPVVDERGKGSLRADGSRVRIAPADVSGRFARARKVVFALLNGVYVALPFVKIGGNPAILLDIARRRFFLFGQTFNAQDTWLVFFLLTGVGFALVVTAAIVGRVWCGWACPQTVFLDGVFRRIERLIEGPRNVHLRRDAGPTTFDKAWRKATKHAIFLLIAVVLAHVLLAYFVSLPGVFTFISGAPSKHAEAFTWTTAVTLVLYGNFAWFREQLCLIICPYGRLQAVLSDRDTITIGYDGKRGEPRGKASDPSAGACVDCHRCVVVCPTGIDIRNGQQLDCIGCTACIDACDEVMDQLKRPRGLVRFDSLQGLTGGVKRLLRPRLYLYAVLLLAGITAASIAIASHEPFEANVLRMPGLPFALAEGPRGVSTVRNTYEIHLVNKQAEARTFVVAPVSPPGVAMSYALTAERITLASMSERRVPFVVTLPESAFRAGLDAVLDVTMEGAGRVTRRVRAPFAGPPR
jgi:cytochrome c oxidase accessory protein FixG